METAISLKPLCFALALLASLSPATGQPASEPSAAAVEESPEAPQPPPPLLAGQGRFLLRYQCGREDLTNPDEARRRGGGGLVGALNEIVMRIEQAGSQMPPELKERLTAQAEFTLQVWLHEGVEDEPWRVTLKPESPKTRIPPVMKPSVQNSLLRETREVYAALADWKKELSLEQTLSLKLRGEGALDLDTPLDPLILWPRPTVTLKLHRTLKPEITDLNFFSVGPQGLRPIEKLPFGTPAVVEILFNRPPDRPVHRVRVTAGTGSKELVAQRVDEDPRRFMTPQFVVFPHSDGLPPEPPALRLDPDTSASPFQDQ